MLGCVENDWSSGNYLVHNDIPKVLQQKIVRFLQNQPLGLTILNLRMCEHDYPSTYRLRKGITFQLYKMFSKVCLETTSGVCGITCAALGVAVTTTSWGVASRTLSSLGRKRDCQGTECIDVIIRLRKLCGLRDCKADGCDMMWRSMHQWWMTWMRFPLIVKNPLDKTCQCKHVAVNLPFFAVYPLDR